MFLALLHANAGHRRIEERLCTSRTDLQGSFRHENVQNATQNRKYRNKKPIAMKTKGTMDQKFLDIVKGQQLKCIQTYTQVVSTTCDNERQYEHEHDGC